MIENNHLLSDFSRLKDSCVLIVGDLMLDRFIYGSVDRISPEAPIPVFKITREKNMLGGAGNVAANIASLGAAVRLVSLAGHDAAAAEVTDALSAIKAEHALVPSMRPTTVKTRYIGAGQQMLRVDREEEAAATADTAQKIIDAALRLMDGAGAVILSDYGKGVLTADVITQVIAAASTRNIPVIVDPKGADFSKYKGAAFVTPNRKELEAAAGRAAGDDDAVRTAAMKVIHECGIAGVLATRSKDGMTLVTSNDAPFHIPAEVREVFDVSGAGDTVIATFAAALAAGVPVRNAALLANAAAGIVVGKAGTAVALPEEMTAALDKGLRLQKTQARSHKAVTLAAAAEQAERWRARGLKVGFTNGCFDLLHPGHLSSIRQAKAACDCLVIGLNSDASVKRLKGPARPVQDEKTRAEILSALEMTDLVVIFGDDTPIELIRAIKPDVLVKGGQYKLEEIVGHDLLQSWGGKVVRADMEEGFSTTNTIAKMA